MKLKNQYISLDPKDRLYQTSCPVIGLTGGIATGKSTVSNELEKMGLPIICADKLVKNVYQNSETINHITKYYPDIINKDRNIDFKKLREIFFKSKEIQADIENLIYRQMPLAFKEALAKFKNPELIIYDVPLLFEKGLDKLVDLKVCVYAPESLQISRLVVRDNIDESLAKEILSKQMPITQKKTLSDTIISNTGDLELLRSNINEFTNTFLTS